MLEDEEPPTIADLLGLFTQNTPMAATWGRYRQLEVDSDEAFRALAVRDQNLWCILSYLPVVENGGLHEFLCRRCGDYALETLAALKAIGAEDSFSDLKQVCELFPDKVPSRDYEIRLQQIEQICAAMPIQPSRSQAFLDAAATSNGDDSERIYELLLDYWQRHGDGQP